MIGPRIYFGVTFIHLLCLNTRHLIHSYPMSSSSGGGLNTLSSSSSSLSLSSRRRRPPADLRSPILIGYASNSNSGKAERAIADGVHVIIWSFLHLELDDTSVLGGTIRTPLDLDAIRRIRHMDETVVHLAAFGGWNGPHPPSSSSTMDGNHWVDVFEEFDTANGGIFDGIDWDYEGHDDIITSSTAQFTLETLDIMVDFSINAKARGYIVTMAPAESYLDSTIDIGSIDGQFSLDLDLPPRSWTGYRATDEDRALVEKAGFRHAGRQCYVYVLAKAGIDTFDWVSIQLYEAFSPFAHDVHRRHCDQGEALMMRIKKLIDGYTVTGLPLDPPEVVVRVPPSKLVIGIANGWVDGMKFCNVDPRSIRSAYEQTLTEFGQGFLGVMFWTIEEEGDDRDCNDDCKRLTLQLSREFKNLGHLSSEL